MKNTMARKKNTQNSYESAIPYVRGIILYLCLLTLFGGVILIVQAGMEEKRIRYQLTERIKDKRQLMEQVKKLDNRINGLESFSRISSLVENRLPHLSPSQYPAIVIQVPGLTLDNRENLPQISLMEDNSWVSRFRIQWRKMEEKIQNHLKRMVE